MCHSCPLAAYYCDNFYVGTPVGHIAIIHYCIGTIVSPRRLYQHHSGKKERIGLGPLQWGSASWSNCIFPPTPEQMGQCPELPTVPVRGDKWDAFLDLLGMDTVVNNTRKSAHKMDPIDMHYMKVGTMIMHDTYVRGRNAWQSIYLWECMPPQHRDTERAQVPPAFATQP